MCACNPFIHKPVPLTPLFLTLLPSPFSLLLLPSPSPFSLLLYPFSLLLLPSPFSLHPLSPPTSHLPPPISHLGPPSPTLFYLPSFHPAPSTTPHTTAPEDPLSPSALSEWTAASLLRRPAIVLTLLPILPAAERPSWMLSRAWPPFPTIVEPGSLCPGLLPVVICTSPPTSLTSILISCFDVDRR